MEQVIKHIQFDNTTNPKSYFDVVRIEELLFRNLDHDIEKNHIVRFYIIFIVLEGNGLHGIDFEDYKYQKGTVLLIRQDQIQKFFKNNQVKGYLLIFTEEFILGHLNKIESSKSFGLFNKLIGFPKIEIDPEKKEFSDLTILIKQIESEYRLKDEYAIGITRSAIHILITKLLRIRFSNQEFSSNKKYLEEFLSFQKMVEKNCFSNKKVKYYADQMGCSTKTLNNIAHAIVNKSAKYFINETVITQIKRLLIGSNKPIKEIAYASGFDDTSNFFKYFKKYAGSSPEAFRKAHQ